MGGRFDHPQQPARCAADPIWERTGGPRTIPSERFFYAGDPGISNNEYKEFFTREGVKTINYPVMDLASALYGEVLDVEP
jgi:hypothetical protein